MTTGDAQQPQTPQQRPNTPATNGTQGAAAPRIITVDQLRRIMTNLRQARAEAYIDPLNRAMAEFEINTRLRVSAFIAQVAHESMEFLYFEEIASGQAYDITVNPRKARELGNVNPGDGRRYKGRGPIQLTGRANYRLAGRQLGLDLEGNPTIVATPNVGFRSSAWYWGNRHLNALADARNFRELTRRINAARRHYARRVMYYERALLVLRDMP